MAKRFTDTTKWDHEWFYLLKAQQKLLWMYLCDKCDLAGVWEKNFSLASHQLGFKVTRELLAEFGDRIVDLGDNKLWLKAFVAFQYGELRDNNNAHKAVISRLAKLGIKPDGSGAHEPLTSPSRGAQDKDKEKAKAFSNSNLSLSLSSKKEGVIGGENDTLNNRIWESYRENYSKRYKKEPVRNAMVNSQIAGLSKRLGEEAIDVVQFYVTHNKGYYVEQCHPIGLCLKDAESLHTQWVRGRAITKNDVREFERQDHNRSLLERIERGEI